jgi:hypothetical protein
MASEAGNRGDAQCWRKAAWLAVAALVLLPFALLLAVVTIAP